MRIITGKYKGRKLFTLAGHNTRPMTDRMKESVFNVIVQYFDGVDVLDLFGGSGALSLEAISRGITHATIVEKAADATAIIMKNVHTLQANEETTVLRMDYQRALERLANQKKYDLIFIDPPFRMNIVDEILVTLQEKEVLKQDAYIICQYVKTNHIPKETVHLKIIKHYRTGNSELCIYQYIL